MQGRLFTDYYLSEGIRDTDEWKDSVSPPGEFALFREEARQLYKTVSGYNEPNEAVTERDLIWPVLELLGWADYLPQQGMEGNEDIPDLLMFADAASKDLAASAEKAEQRYKAAVAVTESKRLGRPLESRGGENLWTSQSPHGQILKYLLAADGTSEGKIRWGILTSGDVWRLYYSRARPRATGYFEVDLGAALESDEDDLLRLFYLLFRRESFVAQEGANTTFLQAALDEGRLYEERVASDLSTIVFETVFPRLVSALARESGEDLGTVREAALIFLYRLLFILYAEDRGLLPVNDPSYQAYGLRERVREDIADRVEKKSVILPETTTYYDHVMALCRLVDKGSPLIGLPPYNGGLFASDAAPMLNEVKLGDATLALVIYRLSHTGGDGGHKFINYRDMSVQQLGSIYERLLEQEPVRSEDGSIEVRPNSYARKDSGSFYTPQELVDLIIDRTLKPLVDERLEAFEKRAEELASDSQTY